MVEPSSALRSYRSRNPVSATVKVIAMGKDTPVSPSRMPLGVRNWDTFPRPESLDRLSRVVWSGFSASVEGQTGKRRDVIEL